MIAAFLGIPLIVWGSLCLLVALLYMVIHPHPDKEAHQGSDRKLRRLILRWAHSFVWLLLGLACFMWGDYVPGGTTLANILALLSLLIYVTFMVTFLLGRGLKRRT